MRDLPSEVIVSISSYLKLLDKLECVLVCKSWNTVITNANLFQKLDFKDNEKLVWAMIMFKSLPQLANQVKTLYLPLISEQYIIDQLPLVFPQISDIAIVYHPRHAGPHRYISNWTNLCKIKERTFGDFSTTLLQSPCQHLRHLRLESLDENKKRDLLLCLKNAPVLEELHIDTRCMCLQEMQLLHTSAPPVKDLHLMLKSLEDDEYGKETNLIEVQPADELKKFFFLFDYAPQSVVDRWIEYFGKKYKNLEDISICALESQHEHYEAAVTNMLKEMKYLKSFDIDITPLTTDLLDGITSQLERIKISLEEEYEDNEDNDSNEVMMEHSAVISSIATKNIKSIIVNGRDEHITDKQQLWMHKAKEASLTFTQLVELSLVSWFCDPEYLSHMLTFFPNLETLKVESLNCMPYDLENTTNTTNIKNLELDLLIASEEELSQYDLNYILARCPRLEQITLRHHKDYSDDEPRGEMHLDLRSHKKLKNIKLEADFPHYYTFEHIAEKRGRRWSSFYTELIPYEGNDFLINLAWSGYNVELDLD